MRSQLLTIAAAAMLWMASFPVGAQQASQACSVANGKATGDCGENGNPNAATTHLDVRGSQTVRKMAASATVYAGGNLAVHGQINGPVTVQRGGVLNVNGQVSGPITCRGGTVIVRGQVAALEADSGCSVQIYGQVHSLRAAGAKVFVSAGAIVNGKAVEHSSGR
jgi:cytoskeletal protein CcmA (bactofilin family)